MSDRPRLLLAGGVFVFESACGSPVRLSPAFDLFRAGDACDAPITAAYRVHAPASASWRVPPAREQIWITDTWRLDRGDDDSILLSIHTLPDEHPLAVARFAPDFSEGELLCRAGRHGAPTPYAFNYPCDQVAVLNALNPRGVGIVHAGGVAFEGNGLLFCGKSGAGKTTLSRLCRAAGATLLNDDRQFMWADGDSARLAPTPWHGLEPEIHNVTTPLRAIFHLVQAAKNRVTALSPAESAARLLGNTVAPFYRADAMARALEWADAITARVPSYRLEFTPTQDAVRLCRETVG